MELPLPSLFSFWPHLVDHVGKNRCIYVFSDFVFPLHVFESLHLRVREVFRISDELFVLNLNTENSNACRLSEIKAVSSFIWTRATYRHTANLHI